MFLWVLEILMTYKEIALLTELGLFKLEPSSTRTSFLFLPGGGNIASDLICLWMLVTIVVPFLLGKKLGITILWLIVRGHTICSRKAHLFLKKKIIIFILFISGARIQSELLEHTLLIICSQWILLMLCGWLDSDHLSVPMCMNMITFLYEDCQMISSLQRLKLCFTFPI